MSKETYYKTRETCFFSNNNNGELTFYKNDVELVNIDNSKMDIHLFKSNLKREIYNYMFPFDNIVVLAGAGASIICNEDNLPDSNYGHTVNMLAQEINQVLKSNDEVYSVHDLATMCKYPVCIEIEGQFNPEFNLEDFLSKVITFEEFMIESDEKLKYSKTKDEILRIIKNKTSYSFERSKHNHSSLIKTLSNIHKSPNRLSIVTTNYDTLFEDAACHLSFTVFDGFSFDSNRKFDIDLFDWSLVRPISNVKSDKLEYKKSSINLLKIHGSLDWTIKNDSVIRVDKLSNSEPIMIFPSSNKYSHSYEKPYFELFSKFQELIKRPNTLLLSIGFSFADNHIAKMITQAVKTTPSLSLLISDYTIDNVNTNKNWDELKLLMNDGYRVSFLKATLGNDLLEYLGESKNDD